MEANRFTLQSTELILLGPARDLNSDNIVSYLGRYEICGFNQSIMKNY